MIFKIIVVGAGIYWLYRWYGQPSIDPPAQEEEQDAEYEELD